MRYVVTVKHPSNPLHDPLTKVTGPCPASANCTDATGEHHSLVVRANSVTAVLQYFASRNTHVTRIEELAAAHDVDADQP